MKHLIFTELALRCRETLCLLLIMISQRSQKLDEVLVANIAVCLFVINVASCPRTALDLGGSDHYQVSLSCQTP